MLEVPLQDGIYCFPLQEIVNQRFILKSMDAYVQLPDAITQWRKENKRTTYDKYQRYIDQRLGVLEEQLNPRQIESSDLKLKTSLGQAAITLSAESPLEKAPAMRSTAKSFYHNNLNEPSHPRNIGKTCFYGSGNGDENNPVEVKSGKLVDFLNSMNRTEGFGSFCKTMNHLKMPHNGFYEKKKKRHRQSFKDQNGDDKVNLFFSSKSMHALPWSIPDHDILFTTNENGCLKELSIKDQTLHKDWGQIHEDRIMAMKITPDGTYLITADEKGNLKQWSIQTKRLVWDYGQVHNGWIGSLVVVPNGLYLFTAGEHGILKQWSIKHMKLWKDYGVAHKKSIFALAVTPDGDSLFAASGDSHGY